MKNALLALVICLPFASPVAAADFTACEVVEIVAAGDQNAHVQLSCVISNAPACAVATNYVGFDKSTAAGKQYLAMFLSAQALNGKVEGWVDHASCPPWQGNVALLTHLRLRR